MTLYMKCCNICGHILVQAQSEEHKSQQTLNTKWKTAAVSSLSCNKWIKLVWKVSTVIPKCLMYCSIWYTLCWPTGINFCWATKFMLNRREETGSIQVASYGTGFDMGSDPSRLHSGGSSCRVSLIYWIWRRAPEWRQKRTPMRTGGTNIWCIWVQKRRFL